MTAAPDVKPQATGGWCWRSFGGVLMLVTETGGAQVVLAAGHRPKPDGLYTRDPKTGQLRRLQEDDAAARMIAAAPDLQAAIEDADGCFEAALAEGWIEALAEGDIERIRDIWERRLSHARNLFPAAIAKAVPA